MQAYEKGIKAGDTRMLLAPDSEFFKYFNDPTGGTPPPEADAKRMSDLLVASGSVLVIEGLLWALAAAAAAATARGGGEHARAEPAHRRGCGRCGGSRASCG